MSSISRYPRIIKSKILAYSDFALASCTRVANAPLTSMLKILPDPIINWHFCQNKQIIATLLLVFNQFATKSIQNNQKSKIFGRRSTQNLGIAQVVKIL